MIIVFASKNIFYLLNFSFYLWLQFPLRKMVLSSFPSSKSHLSALHLQVLTQTHTERGSEICSSWLLLGNMQSQGNCQVASRQFSTWDTFLWFLIWRNHLNVFLRWFHIEIITLEKPHSSLLFQVWLFFKIRNEYWIIPTAFFLDTLSFLTITAISYFLLFLNTFFLTTFFLFFILHFTLLISVLSRISSLVCFSNICSASL